MKVVLIVENLRLRGKQRRIVELIKGLHHSSNIEMELIVLSDQVLYDEVNKLDINIHLIKRKWKKDPTLIYKIYKKCRVIGPDIIHVWGSMSAMYTLPTIVGQSIPLINSMVTNATIPKFMDENWRRSRISFPFSRIILSNSNAGIKAYQVPVKKAEVIHNGFNFSRLSGLMPADQVKEKFGLKHSLIVGMVGAFDNRKDYPLLIGAAKQIISKKDDVCFLLVGGGKKIDSCKQLVPKELSDRIIITGQQTGVESIINVFDIGVLLTNVSRHKEGISNSILEYMALEKPVIATDSGGTSEIIEDSKTGFIIPPADQTVLEEKIELLLESVELRKTMGKAGKDRVIKNFGIEKMVKSTYALYTKLLEN